MNSKQREILQREIRGSMQERMLRAIGEAQSANYSISANTATSVSCKLSAHLPI
jgi:hypothetical protein